MGEPGGGRDISSLVQFDLGADSVVRPPFSRVRVRARCTLLCSIQSTSC